MALQTKEDWTKFVTAAGIPPEESATYVSGFANNRLTESSLPDLRISERPWYHYHWQYNHYLETYCTITPTSI